MSLKTLLRFTACVVSYLIHFQVFFNFNTLLQKITFYLEIYFCLFIYKPFLIFGQYTTTLNAFLLRIFHTPQETSYLQASPLDHATFIWSANARSILINDFMYSNEFSLLALMSADRYPNRCY